MDDAISTGLLASLLDLDRYGMRVVSMMGDETAGEVWVKVGTRCGGGRLCRVRGAGKGEGPP